MGDSASTDTFPADVAEVRRAAGITIAPEAALHRALQERTDELERVRRERNDAQAIVRRMLAQDAQDIDTLTRERDEARAELERVRAELTAEKAVARAEYDRGRRDGRADIAKYADAIGAADPPHPGIHGRLLASMPIPVTHQGPARQIRRRTPDEIRAWAAGLFGG